MSSGITVMTSQGDDIFLAASDVVLWEGLI